MSQIVAFGFGLMVRHLYGLAVSSGPKWGHVTAWDQEKRQKDRALRKLVWEQTLSEETRGRAQRERRGAQSSGRSRDGPVGTTTDRVSIQ